MKTILGILLSLGLLVASLPGAAAQAAGPAYVADIGQTAIYKNDEGSEIAALTVDSIDNDFPGYMRGQYADHGYSYRLISFTVENISDADLVISLSSFSVIDMTGKGHHREYVQTDEDAEFETELVVGEGEVVPYELVFMMPAHVEPAMFQWQHEFSYVVLVNLTQGSDEPGAVSQGLRSPAYVTDDFGTTIASIEVTAIDGDWDKYTDWSAPDDGFRFWALRVKVTNDSDRPIRVDSYRFNVITQDGERLRPAIVGTQGDYGNDIYGTLDLMPGDAVEGIVIFEVAEEDQPVILHWNNRMYSWALVILVGDAETMPLENATPVAD